MVKYTKLAERGCRKVTDFMVQKCIWDANHGLTPKRVNATAALMTVGNIKKGKTPKYEELVDLSFANKSIKELGEYKGPLCPSERSGTRAAVAEGGIGPAPCRLDPGRIETRRGALLMTIANEAHAGGIAGFAAAAAEADAVLGAAALSPLWLRRAHPDALGDGRSVGQPNFVFVSLENCGRILRLTVTGELPYYAGRACRSCSTA